MPTIGIDLYLEVGQILVIIALLIILVLRIIDDMAYVPERKAFKDGRKRGAPVLALNELGGNNKTRYYPGKRSKKDEWLFEVPGHKPIHIDVAKITDAEAPQDLGKGLRIFQYSTMHAEPIGVVNALAIKTVMKTITSKFKLIRSLPDDHQTDILTSSDSDLSKDCKNIVQTHHPTDENDIAIDSEELEAEVRDAKKELAITPVELGLFSFNYAFRRIATAATGYHMKMHGEICAAEARKESGKSNVGEWIPLLMIIGLPLGCALAYVMISKLS